MGSWFSGEKFEHQRVFLENHSIKGENLKTWNEPQLARLDRIMNGDKTLDEALGSDDHGEFESSVHKVSFEETFITFSDTHNAWKRLDSVLFWKHYPKLKDLMVIRRQHSGLCCFMHAPVVMQHYLVSIHADSSNFLDMIDMAKYLDQNRNGAFLLEYLKGNQGGNSIEFLKEIFASDIHFQHDSYHIRSDVNKSCEEFLNKLATQPALLSKFSVDHFFLDPKNGTSFLDANSFTPKTNPDYHAMLLLGYRRDGDEIIFLLQNWWKDRYLIEVSANYLRKCDPIITFASSSLNEIPKAFPVISSTYAETYVDCGETYDELLSV